MKVKFISGLSSLHHVYPEAGALESFVLLILFFLFPGPLLLVLLLC